MKKAELLTDLANKFYKIGVIANAETSDQGIAIREQEGINWYIAGVYEKQSNVLVRRNVSFYVANEGKAGEAAFIAEKPLQEKTISTTVTTPFRDLVVDEITKKITSGTILKGIVQGCSENEKFAEILAYVDVAGTVEKKNYFAYEPPDKSLQFKEMK